VKNDPVAVVLVAVVAAEADGMTAEVVTRKLRAAHSTECTAIVLRVALRFGENDDQ